MRVISTADAVPERWTSEAYFDLVERGVLGPDDKVELLEGVIVAMSPHTVRHAAACRLAAEAIRRAISGRAVVSEQLPLQLGPRTAPEPDIAVLPGTLRDYERSHPATALLVVEVADSSLVQDRLTKTGIYAAAGIPEYWIVNLVDDQIEIHRSSEPAARRYRDVHQARRGESIELTSLPGACVVVDDLLPSAD